jgi:glycosyltransferase involved in cell wall biosynthesis
LIIFAYCSRLTLLPGSGVDLQRFNPSLRQAQAGPSRFLYAGRMLADKGLHELIASAPIAVPA